MVAGLWSGFKLFGKIDDETFRKTVLVLVLFAGFFVDRAAGIYCRLIRMSYPMPKAAAKSLPSISLRIVSMPRTGSGREK